MALQQRLDLAVEIGDLEMEAGTRLRIGAVQAELWRLDTARREYDRAREIASGLTERALEGLAFNNIGRLLDQTGDTAGARQFYARALEISLDSADRYLERVARNNLAMSAESDEDRIDQLEAVASLARDLKDRRAEALTENNLGHTFSQIGRTEDAERHYLRALSINQSLGDLASLTLVENNLAMLRLTSMPARAKDPVPWYKPHRRRFLVRLDRGPRIWVWYMTLGIRLTSRRSLRAARAQFKQSLERYENNGNILGMVTALQNLAIFELHRGKHKQSLSRFRQLFEVLERARVEVASEELQTQFFAAHQSLFDMVIPLLVFRRQGEGAFELAERARSRTLLDIITTQTDPEQLPTLASRRIELLEKLRKSDHEWRASDSAEPERKQLELDT